MADPRRDHAVAALDRLGRGAVTQAPVPPPPWLIGGFPVFFVLLWLLSTSALGLFSGWFQLQARFPCNDDAPLLRLRMQSGTMGWWVNLNGILSLEACSSGLRVGIWRIFGLFQRPFQIPWDQIEAEPVTRFLIPMVRLRFGRPEAGRLTITIRAWERLKAASQGMAAPASAATTNRLVRAFVLQWAAITVFAGSFFYLVPHFFAQPTAPIPVTLCFGFPAIFFGVALFVRFLFQAR
jgi:hypothetical protein